MAGTSVERAVAAPPAVVWGIITDLDRTADVISSITAVERLDGGTGFGVGTRWRESRVLFGRQATEVLEVTALDEGRSYTVEADSRGAHYRSVLRVEADGAGSLISMSFEGEPTGTVSRLMASTIGRLFAGSTRKAMQQDLDDIAAAAEAATLKSD